MADPSQEDFTPRVLLRKILSSEPSRSAVRHQPKLRASELEQPSTRNLRSTPKNLNSDISILSPSMKLRSKMKQKVRHSIDRAKTRQGKFLNVEDLDEITPRTLLKRIIQNEPEVSTIVSQRSAEVISEEREEGRRSDATRSSAGNMEISLPEFQEDDARAPVFGTTRKKKRFSITQFQRGVEERLPQTQDTPDVPESIEKRGLVRRPQKRRLICLQDFEEGVEKNYQQLKGLQYSAKAVPETSTSHIEPPVAKSAFYSTTKSARRLEYRPREEAKKQSIEEDNDDDQFTDEEESESEELSQMQSQKVPIKPQVLSPLANTPLYIKNARLKFLNKRPIAKRATKKKTDPGNGKKNEPAYPKSLVKQIFSHYAQMPVSKDAFPVVEKCLDLYMKRMCDDLEAYAHHAKRKTLIKADFELLFRRQGHVTDKRPLNVLIEQYLPLEYRKLLIPMATSGNKVFPKM
ncbi:hypothetical protein FKM82_030275 [Ascaphus truei]